MLSGKGAAQRDPYFISILYLSYPPNVSTFPYEFTSPLLFHLTHLNPTKNHPPCKIWTKNKNSNVSVFPSKPITGNENCLLTMQRIETMSTIPGKFALKAALCPTTFRITRTPSLVLSTRAHLISRSTSFPNRLGLFPPHYAHFLWPTSSWPISQLFLAPPFRESPLT